MTGNVFSYLPLENGKVYIAGRFRQNSAPDENIYIARLLPDGTMDPTFSPPHLSPGDLPNPATGAGVSHIHPWHDDHLILSGRFRYVNGEPRNSICMIDNAGNVLPPFHDQGVGTFQWSTITYSSVSHIIEDDEGRLYIAGAYTGYNDGTINDPGQRFVSRLLVEEDLTVGVREVLERPARLGIEPNPAIDQVVFTYEPEQNGAPYVLVIRDLSGRIQTTIPARYQGRTVWDVSALNSGVYLVELQQAGRVLHSERLIVAR